MCHRFILRSSDVRVTLLRAGFLEPLTTDYSAAATLFGNNNNNNNTGGSSSSGGGRQGDGDKGSSGSNPHASKLVLLSDIQANHRSLFFYIRAKPLLEEILAQLLANTQHATNLSQSTRPINLK